MSSTMYKVKPPTSQSSQPLEIATNQPNMQNKHSLSNPRNLRVLKITSMSLQIRPLTTPATVENAFTTLTILQVHSLLHLPCSTVRTLKVNILSVRQLETENDS